MKPAAEDPIKRYEAIVAAYVPAGPELAPAVLAQFIGDQAANDDARALANHVAQHSRLTVAQAETVVATAIDGQSSPEAKAIAVSEAVAAAAGAGADIQLSDPVMLNPWARVFFAGLLCGAVGGCILCIALLGDESGTAASALIGLTVIGVLALVGVLVLVMGYKNVTITGSAPGSSSS